MLCLFHKEYDAIARLGIDNPQEYLSRRYGNQTKLLKLETCCVGHLVQTRVEAALEEVQGSNGWVDIMVCSLFARYELLLHVTYARYAHTCVCKHSCAFCAEIE